MQPLLNRVLLPISFTNIVNKILSTLADIFWTWQIKNGFRIYNGMVSCTTMRKVKPAQGTEVFKFQVELSALLLNTIKILRRCKTDLLLKAPESTLK